MNTYNISFKELIDYIRDKDYEIQTLQYNIHKLREENERLKSIIKEAREYIESVLSQKGTEYYRIQLLEILDKENK